MAVSRRTRVFATTWVAYASLYLARKPFHPARLYAALSALEPCAHDAPEALWLIDCAPPERQPPPIALYEARFTSA